MSLCAYMKLSKSGYYKWLSRDGRLNRYEINRKDLTALLLNVYKKHSTWGYRHLADQVRKETGWIFSDLMAHKCCKAAGIRSSARKQYSPPGEEHDIYPNLIGKDFTATRPFEKVCTDTTSFYHKGIKYDWNIYLDLFNNEIISYDFRLSKSGNGVKNHYSALNRFLEAKEKRGYKSQVTILHSDQGAIYTSRAFNAHLDSTIKRSMSRLATPTDNPVLESLNGWIKDELMFDFNLKRCKDITSLIKDYVKYYNHVRTAYTLKYKSPVQYRTEQLYS
ncbi:MAG: IS3 family transposase [Acholeplasmataceae bacterium]